MLESKTIKLLGGPNKNKIVVIPANESSIIVFEKFDKDQLILDFYNEESPDKVVSNIKKFRYVDSGIKDDRFSYFIPERKEWFDYKKLRDIYYGRDNKVNKVS